MGHTPTDPIPADEEPTSQPLFRVPRLSDEVIDEISNMLVISRPLEEFVKKVLAHYIRPTSDTPADEHDIQKMAAGADLLNARGRFLSDVGGFITKAAKVVYRANKSKLTGLTPAERIDLITETSKHCFARLELSFREALIEKEYFTTRDIPTPHHDETVAALSCKPAPDANANAAGKKRNHVDTLDNGDTSSTILPDVMTNDQVFKRLRICGLNELVLNTCDPDRFAQGCPPSRWKP